MGWLHRDDCRRRRDAGNSGHDAGNDVGVLSYRGGPTVAAVFTGQNTGDFFRLEATEGRIAELLVKAWQ